MKLWLLIHVLEIKIIYIWSAFSNWVMPLLLSSLIYLYTCSDYRGDECYVHLNLSGNIRNPSYIFAYLIHVCGLVTNQLQMGFMFWIFKMEFSIPIIIYKIAWVDINEEIFLFLQKQKCCIIQDLVFQIVIVLWIGPFVNPFFHQRLNCQIESLS